MVPCYVTVFISIPLNRAPKLGGFLPCRGGLLRKSSFACSLRAQYLPDSKFHWKESIWPYNTWSQRLAETKATSLSSNQTMASNDSGYLSSESFWAKGPLAWIAINLYVPSLGILPGGTWLEPNDGELRLRVPKLRVLLSKRSSCLDRYQSLRSQSWNLTKGNMARAKRWRVAIRGTWAQSLTEQKKLALESLLTFILPRGGYFKPIQGA